MAGPWEDYAPAAASGPWEDYGVKKEKPPAQQGGLWNSAADFFKSIPTGAVKGLAGTIAASGQAEAGLQGMEGVPGPEKSAQIMGAGSMHQPQGQAGRFGEAIGGALGNPTSYLGAGGMIPKALGAIGAGAGGQAAAEMFPNSSIAPVIGGALGGVAGGGLPRAASRFTTPNPIAPERAVAAKALKELGASAGDVLGSPKLQATERMGDFAGGGGSFERLKIPVEQKVTERGLGLMGEQGNRITPEVSENFRSRNSDMFEQAERKFKVRFDDDFGDGLVNIQREIQRRMPEADRKVLLSLIDDLDPTQNPPPIRYQGADIPGPSRWTVPKESKTAIPEMTGGTYATFTKKGSNLDRAINSNNPDVAHYAMRIRDVLDDALERSARGAQQKKGVEMIREARRQFYNHMMIMQSLADPRDAAREGLIDPQKLVRNMQKGGSDAKMNYLRSKTDLHALAETARRLTPYKETSSLFGSEHEGGGGRGVVRLVGGGVGGTIGGLVGSAFGPAGTGVGATAGATAGAALGPGVTGRVINSPTVQRYLKNQFWIRHPETGSLKQRAIVGGAVGGQAAKKKQLYEE